jgi:hypothetical protein
MLNISGADFPAFAPLDAAIPTEGFIQAWNVFIRNDAHRVIVLTLLLWNGKALTNSI